MLLYTCKSMWIKKVGCHAGRQEVSKCCTRGESEDQLYADQEALTPDQMSPEVQNRTTKRTDVLPNF